MMINAACIILLSLLTPVQTAGLPVKSKVDPKADFSALRTYAWGSGHKAYNPAAHEAIVTAVDGELSARGLKRVEGAGADVTVRYHTVLELDVDIDVLEQRAKQGKGGLAPMKKLGMLAIVVSRPGGDVLWGAQTREHVDETSLGETIRRVVSRLFETYPDPSKARRF